MIRPLDGRVDFTVLYYICTTYVSLYHVCFYIEIGTYVNFGDLVNLFVPPIQKCVIASSKWRPY